MSVLDSPIYHLNLQSDRRRVFVTQIRDEDEEDNEVEKIPIVKEKAGQLVELGYNTLQKTLLLKKKNDIHQVDQEFQKKKEEIKIRLQRCKEKERKTLETKEKLEERKKRFNFYIGENNAKRRRALTKFQKEEKCKQTKAAEIELLKANLDEHMSRLESLKKKISKYTTFEKYLCRVIDALPEDYLEASDNMINSLMMRFQTLSDTNTNLTRKNDDLVKQLKDLQLQLSHSPSNQSEDLLLYNKEIAERQRHINNMYEINAEMEQQNEMKKQKYLKMSKVIGQVKLAIENLAEKCERRTGSMEGLALDRKLWWIGEYIKEREAVYEMSCPGDEKPVNKNPILKLAIKVE